MGLLNYLNKKFSRGPAIVGTTNTLARHFLKIQNEAPGVKPIEIYKRILDERYALLPIAVEKQTKLLTELNSINGFKTFVMKVLKTETELAETPIEFKIQVSDVVENELKKYKGLPPWRTER